MRSSLEDGINMLNKWKTASTNLQFSCSSPLLDIFARVEVIEVCQDATKLGISGLTEITLRLSGGLECSISTTSELSKLEQQQYVSCLQFTTLGHDRANIAFL